MDLSVSTSVLLDHPLCVCDADECVCDAKKMTLDSFELPASAGTLRDSEGKKDENDWGERCNKCFLLSDQCDGSCICRHCGKTSCDYICRCPNCHEDTGCDCDLSELGILAFKGKMPMCPNCHTHANPNNLLGCNHTSCLSLDLKYDQDNNLVHLYTDELGNCNKCHKTPDKCMGYCVCCACDRRDCIGSTDCSECGGVHCRFDDCVRNFECKYCYGLLSHPDETCWCYYSAKYNGHRD